MNYRLVAGYILICLVFTSIAIYLSLSPCNTLKNYSNCYRSESLGGNYFLHLCFENGKPQFDIRKFNNKSLSCEGTILNLNQFYILNSQCSKLEDYKSCFKKQALGKDFFLHLCNIENKTWADIRLFINTKPTCQGIMLELIQLELITRFNRDLII